MDKIKQFFKNNFIYIFVLIIVLLLRFYVVSLIKVNGDSMVDTLHNKDIMILNKIKYRFNPIERFDIVVINEKNEYLIKRVIGLPGEVIEYKNNILYINGKKQAENFSHKRTADFSTSDLGSTKIPKDSYLVLGDNRTNSADSRIIGFIAKENIIGKASFTILPFNRIGSKK